MKLVALLAVAVCYFHSRCVNGKYMEYSVKLCHIMISPSLFYHVCGSYLNNPHYVPQRCQYCVIFYAAQTPTIEPAAMTTTMAMPGKHV